MRGPSSFTAVELCKCQHQTVVDLVDLAGMESLVVPALKAVQVAQILVLRAGEMTGRLVRAVMTTVRRVRAVMMIVRVVGLVGMMIVWRVRDVTMTVRRALVEMMIVRVVGLVGMMRVHVSVVMMIVQRVRAVMTTVRAFAVMMIARVVGLVGMTLVQPGLAPQLSSERMRFVTRVVVAG